MLNSIDVANFFIDLAKSDPYNDMTNIRVNKMLFFAQGWSLVRRGKALFKEDLRAWTYGPVAPSVYYAFQPCGNQKIVDYSGKFDPEKFSAEEIDLLLDVSREYDKYSTTKLVDMTHAKGSPWQQVYQEYENKVISKSSISEYFKTLDPLEPFSPSIDEGDFVGRRDPETGLLVLPKELDDDAE